MEKMAYTLVMESRKLRHYFTAHKITVPTSLPLCDMFENREAIGRIAKWATEIAPFMLPFIARTTIKYEALPEFVVNWMPQAEVPEEVPLDPVWIVYYDRAWGLRVWARR